MSSNEIDQALRQSCPTCFAAIGEECKSGTVLHSSRLGIAAERLRRVMEHSTHESRAFGDKRPPLPREEDGSWPADPPESPRDSEDIEWWKARFTEQHAAANKYWSERNELRLELARASLRVQEQLAAARKAALEEAAVICDTYVGRHLIQVRGGSGGGARDFHLERVDAGRTLADDIRERAAENPAR